MTAGPRKAAWLPRAGAPAWHVPTSSWALVREIDIRATPMTCQITLSSGVQLSCPATALQAEAPPAVSPAQLRGALDAWRDDKAARGRKTSPD